MGLKINFNNKIFNRSIVVFSCFCFVSKILFGKKLFDNTNYQGQPVKVPALGL